MDGTSAELKTQHPGISAGRGLMMSRGNVKGGRGRIVTRNDRAGWNFDSSGMSAISLPVIPAMY
jgi:hypothetical protein